MGGAVLALGTVLLWPSPAGAADGTAELGYVLNTFALLVWGAFVFWMCAGFTMLEAGTVRIKNSSMVCLKNVGTFCIAAVTYFVIGYNLMYVDVGGFIGSFELFRSPLEAESALMEGAPGSIPAGSGHSASMSHWLFQMLFVATAASIVSGALLERTRLRSFWMFTALLTAVVYPIVGAWSWGGGWLHDLGFVDFAGGSVVHSVGGAAALAGVLIVGPRTGKFRPDGSVKFTPPSNVLLVTLGILILWLGFFGFNAGSQAALTTPGDAIAMTAILVNTNLAAAAGFLVAAACSRPIFGRLGATNSLNGALAGLVSVTAAPVFGEHWWALVLGGVAGLLCTLATWLLEWLRLDDVVGAIPVHLVAGVWGSLAAAVMTDAEIGPQLIGTAAIVAFSFAASWLLWKALDLATNVRVDPSVERVGQDVAELGIEALPEFVLAPDES